jgi:thiamine pyrophosphate-dependent acetolactate synthase large subunit-like protein
VKQVLAVPQDILAQKVQLVIAVTQVTLEPQVKEASRVQLDKLVQLVKKANRV